MGRQVPAFSALDDIHDLDGCLCGVKNRKSEQTSDMDLPIARGGVDTEPSEAAGKIEIDGCDVDFNDEKATPDEELPVAAGG